MPIVLLAVMLVEAALNCVEFGRVPFTKVCRRAAAWPLSCVLHRDAIHNMSRVHRTTARPCFKSILVFVMLLQASG